MRTFVLAMSLLLITACSGPADMPDNAAGGSTVSIEDTDTGDVLAPMAGEKSGGAIPAALRGRWGLVPADCTSTRGDAKGLIEVSGNAVRFYESSGEIETATGSDADSDRANFAFTGEGQTWVRDMEWSLTDSGNNLIRSEFGDEALAEPLTYTKCN